MSVNKTCFSEDSLKSWNVSTIAPHRLLMSSPIQSLPREVINLIAAGEVIDSLAAVVRELVENSLDAGATSIYISLWPDLWRVQVADNGRGMTLRDLKFCAEPHSTSKIRSSEDLYRISTLGFRGEALHSLTQVADLEILSRSVEDIEEGVGWRIVYRKGKIIKEEPVAIATGTIVTVSNLFAKLPLRRKSLPSTSKQLKAVQEIIGEIALCHPQVTWQVRQKEQLWLQISPGTSADRILPQIVNRLRQSDLQLLKLDLKTPNEENLETVEKSKMELTIGLPDRCHRRRADWIKVGINGRVVRAPEIEQTIISAFARTLPRDRYPVCFVHLQTSPSQIDWNRHPAKAKIYLHSIKYWQEQVALAIERALRISPANLPAAENQRVGKLLKASEEKGTYSIKERSKNKKEEVSLIDLRAVAQVRNTYIVAEHPTGLWLIEQHIAHERILYEQLQDDWKLVALETPIILSQLKSAQLEQLQRLGIEIENFGEQLWTVRAIPEMLQQRDDITDAIVELSWGGDLQEAQVATACRSAIRNGTPLNLSQMQTLLDQWKSTRNPSTCPHGRPIYLSLEETALSRFFRRNWVIGKSHGI